MRPRGAPPLIGHAETLDGGRRPCADDANRANSGNRVEQLYEPRRPDSSRAASIRTDGKLGLIRIGLLFAADRCRQHLEKGETSMAKNKSDWRGVTTGT